MRKLFILCFTALTVLAVSCSKDDNESFATVEGAWSSHKTIGESYTPVRQTIFLKPGNVAKIYQFNSATLKYSFDGTYSISGTTLTLQYEDNVANENVTAVLNVDGDKKESLGSWTSTVLGGSTAGNAGKIFMFRVSMTEDQVVL